MLIRRVKKKINIFRSLVHLKHKIFRLKEPPVSISIGLAWGAAVSFTPLIGLHIAICLLGTYLMKGNMLAALAGTVIGNPWTFPLIFFIDYKLGVFFGITGVASFEISLNFFYLNFEKIFFPTLIGSIPLFLFVWFITYNISIFVIQRYKK